MNIQDQIKQLAALEPVAEAPLISLYLDMNPHEKLSRDLFIKDKLALFDKAYAAGSTSARSFQNSWQRIESFLQHEVEPVNKGVALFARWQPDVNYFLGLQIPQPFENRFVVDSVPHIFPLVAYQDNSYHYVVMVSDSRQAKIFEVQFGSIRDIHDLERPEDAKSFRSEWTRLHYRNWKKDKQRRFVKAKVKVLEDLMRQKGIEHLILAGDEVMLGEIRRELSKWLQERVVEVADLDLRSKENDLLADSLAAFARFEREESNNSVEQLQQEAATDGLAVLGDEATLQALNHARVDQLLVEMSFAARSAWKCEACEYAAVRKPEGQCPQCGAPDFCEVDLKEELIRKAVLFDASIETVEDSAWLRRYDAVGALLRYK